MTESKTALVTGGGGFLGSAIVRMLVAQGRTVRSFSRNHHPELAQLNVEQIHGDIADLNRVQRACRDVEVVFHTAAKPGLGGSYHAYYATNVIGTRNIVQACRDDGVARLIHTSSPSVIFDGGDMEGVDESVPYPSDYHGHYAQTKAMAEKLVIAAAQQGLPVIILRPHLIWGPGDNHLVPGILARASRLRRIGPGTNLVDTIYIDNAARSHLLADKALKKNPDLSGNVYFVSQDEPIRLWEMINRILAAGNRPPISGTLSPRLAYGLGALFELIFKVLKIDKDPPMTRFAAGELATSHWFDISAAKRDLGYFPEVSIEEGLARLAQWLEGKKPAQLGNMS